MLNEIFVPHTTIIIALTPCFTADFQYNSNEHQQ